MIKVIERAHTPDDPVHRFRCKSCTSLLQANKSDAKEVDDQRDGRALVIECPVCETVNWISVSVWGRTSV